MDNSAIRGKVLPILITEEVYISEDAECFKLENFFGIEKFFDDRVDYWHTKYEGRKPLQEFMGCNDKEWKCFVHSPSVFYKKYGLSIMRYLEDK